MRNISFALQCCLCWWCEFWKVMFILPLCCTVKQQNIICGCGISNGSQFLCSTSSTQVRSWGGGSTATHTLPGWKCWCATAIARSTPLPEMWLLMEWIQQHNNPISLALIQLICQRKRKVVTLPMMKLVRKLRLTKQRNLLSTLHWKEAGITRTVRKLCASVSNFNCKKKT